jgi:hypothetical protein
VQLEVGEKLWEAAAAALSRAAEAGQWAAAVAGQWTAAVAGQGATAVAGQWAAAGSEGTLAERTAVVSSVAAVVPIREGKAAGAATLREDVQGGAEDADILP